MKGETTYVRRLEKLYAAILMQAIKDVKHSSTAVSFLESEPFYKRAAKMALENRIPNAGRHAIKRHFKEVRFGGLQQTTQGSFTKGEEKDNGNKHDSTWTGPREGQVNPD